jgi:hypothetical protein
LKKGQLNLARMEGLGAAEIGHQRGDADVLRLRLTDLTAEQATKLKEVLAEQVEGFQWGVCVRRMQWGLAGSPSAVDNHPYRIATRILQPGRTSS